MWSVHFRLTGNQQEEEGKTRKKIRSIGKIFFKSLRYVLRRYSHSLSAFFLSIRFDWIEMLFIFAENSEPVEPKKREPWLFLNSCAPITAMLEFYIYFFFSERCAQSFFFSVQKIVAVVVNRIELNSFHSSNGNRWKAVLTTRSSMKYIEMICSLPPSLLFHTQ